jgi:hypothetical protein
MKSHRLLLSFRGLRDPASMGTSDLRRHGPRAWQESDSKVPSLEAAEKGNRRAQCVGRCAAAIVEELDNL